MLVLSKNIMKSSLMDIKELKTHPRFFPVPEIPVSKDLEKDIILMRQKWTRDITLQDFHIYSL